MNDAELLRGAGSALYGSGGVGGVLEIDTFGPHPGPGFATNGRGITSARVAAGEIPGGAGAR